jgi:putative redox protein
MNLQKLSFESTSGQQLAARLGLPDDREPVAYALFAHCFTCNKNYKAMANISRAMAERGIGVLRFDFTGLGESEGDFAETDFSSNVADLVAAAHFLESEYQAPKILVGHSLGGSAALQAAGRIASCRAVVTIAAPSETGHLAHLLRSRAEEIEATGQAQVNVGGRTFTIKKQLLDDLERTHMRATIRDLDRALLVCHSPQDRTVAVENAIHIFEAASYPKAFLSLDGADHLLSEERDSLYLGSVIVAWAERYLEGW